MAGFGAAKKMQEDREEELPPVGAPAKAKKEVDPFADLRIELGLLHQQQPKSTLFALIAGHENTGKTAIVLDAFRRYLEGDGK